jgi:hypothetical protein
MKEMNQPDQFDHAVIIHTEDLALLECLGALREHCQRDVRPRGRRPRTKKSEWESSGHLATFHFSSPETREAFMGEIERLFPENLWQEIARSDDGYAGTPTT